MRKEFEERLVKDFPLLYRDTDKHPTESLMCFGFECSDGWFSLIYDLSSKLEPLIATWIKNCDDLDMIQWYPRAMQVKEKYGGLRFYMTSATDEMYELIDDAENKSVEICDICGEPGKCNEMGWIACRCDKHRDD